MKKNKIICDIGKFLDDINKKYPTQKDETNVITIEGTDLVVYQIWDQKWENSNWLELERISL